MVGWNITQLFELTTVKITVKIQTAKYVKKEHCSSFRKKAFVKRKYSGLDGLQMWKVVLVWDTCDHCFLKKAVLVRLVKMTKKDDRISPVSMTELYFCKDNTYFTKIINTKHETFVLFYQ